MQRPTEFQMMKRLLFARKDFDPDLHGNEVNSMIRESCDAAVESDDLLDRDRDIIKGMAKKFEKGKYKFNGVPVKMTRSKAYELLAALAPFVHVNEFLSNERSEG